MCKNSPSLAIISAPIPLCSGAAEGSAHQQQHQHLIKFYLKSKTYTVLFCYLVNTSKVEYIVKIDTA